MNLATTCFPIHRILKISTPSDFFLFADLKKMFAAMKFSTNEEVVAETEVYFVVSPSKVSILNNKIEFTKKKCV
jgi:hypothetical protein